MERSERILKSTVIAEPEHLQDEIVNVGMSRPIIKSIIKAESQCFEDEYVNKNRETANTGLS